MKAIEINKTNPLWRDLVQAILMAFNRAPESRVDIYENSDTGRRIFGGGISGADLRQVSDLGDMIVLHPNNGIIWLRPEELTGYSNDYSELQFIINTR